MKSPPPDPAAVSRLSSAVESLVCRYCGVPSSLFFCSDECEQLSDWERPGSTDAGPGRFNLPSTIVDTCVMAVLLPAVLSLLAL